MKTMALLIAAFFLIFGLVAGEARASIVSYQLGGVFNGTAPTSTAPWLTASFEDSESGKVTLTLTSSLEVTSEFISQVAFNVHPSITPSSLGISQNSGPTATIAKSTQGDQKIDGNAGKGFDVLLGFPTEGGASRFDGSDVAVFTITLASITANSFAWQSTGGSPNYVGAHVQGIPGVPPSGHIGTVPIPSAVWLLASGLLGLIGIRRRFKK